MITQDELNRIDSHSKDRELYEKNTFTEAKALSKKAKINEQSPLIQKYWLGRLAYELAIRNEDVIRIKEKESNSVKLIIALDEYGFTSMPEDNVLKTEHTSYPTFLIHDEYGKININTIFNFEKLFDILNGAPKSKYAMSNSNYIQWKNIGKEYTTTTIYLDLIHLY